MNPNVPPLPNKDEDHLKILSILHYVMAGLMALGILGLIGHFMLMNTVMTNPAFIEDGGSPPPQELIGMMRGFYVVAAFFLIIEIVLNFLCARSLKANNNRILCFITSGLNCLNMPLGTALGVFTIVVLMRPSVIDRYQSKRPH